jgi:hypothetical protein
MSVIPIAAKSRGFWSGFARALESYSAERTGLAVRKIALRRSQRESDRSRLLMLGRSMAPAEARIVRASSRGDAGTWRR